jgi:hypothetical protein
MIGYIFLYIFYLILTPNSFSLFSYLFCWTPPCFSTGLYNYNYVINLSFLPFVFIFSCWLTERYHLCNNTRLLRKTSNLGCFLIHTILKERRIAIVICERCITIFVVVSMPRKKIAINLLVRLSHASQHVSTIVIMLSIRLSYYKFGSNKK